MDIISKLHNDNKAVAFLVFYILAALFSFGMTYAILSDIRDATAIPIFNDIAPLGAEYNDSDTAWGFDFLNFLISFSVMFFVIGLIWYAKQRAQRQEVQWQY